MFNDYFEEKHVGYTSIPRQKINLGINDTSYLEFGKGVVKPEDKVDGTVKDEDSQK